jgi:hypothetical protein
MALWRILAPLLPRRRRACQAVTTGQAKRRREGKGGDGKSDRRRVKLLSSFVQRIDAAAAGPIIDLHASRSRPPTTG